MTPNRITAEADGVHLDLLLPNPNDSPPKLTGSPRPAEVPMLAARLAKAYRQAWEASLDLPVEPAKKVVERDPGGRIIALVDRPGWDGRAVGKQLGDAVEARLTTWYTDALVGTLELRLQRDSDYGSRRMEKPR